MRDALKGQYVIRAFFLVLVVLGLSGACIMSQLEELRKELAEALKHCRLRRTTRGAHRRRVPERNPLNTFPTKWGDINSPTWSRRRNVGLTHV